MFCSYSKGGFAAVATEIIFKMAEEIGFLCVAIEATLEIFNTCFWHHMGVKLLMIEDLQSLV